MAHTRSAWFGAGSNGGRYRAASASASAFDTEKQRTSNDSDEAPSLVSSEQPMLSQSSPRPRNYALSYHLPRRRFTRYFTCGIASILILLAFFLVSSSYRNEAQIKLGLKKAPKPPPIWESFPFVKGYYGGIRSLVRREENVPEYPNATAEDQILLDMAMRRKAIDDVVDPESGIGFQKRAEERSIPHGMRFDPYEAADSGSSFYEEHVPCYLDQKSKVRIPQVLAYSGVPEGFPDPAMGSHDLFGLRNDVCFERYGRLGQYGYGYSKTFGGSGAGMEGEKEGSEEVWGDQLEVDYRDVRWAEVQQDCMDANAHRFRPATGQLNHFYKTMATGSPMSEDAWVAADADKYQETDKMLGPNGKKLVPRTAIIIRTWKAYDYDAEDMFYLRALMNELSLQSGTQYVVHFLIHVKDNDLQIWADEDTYHRALTEALPEEFRGMGTLWSERQMELIYGGMRESNYRNLPVHGVYRSTYMPLQYFAHMHPEYDFYWHWEMDIRYTGHFHHLFDKITKWAKKQPRKELWERNARFYVPSVHGSWENFSKMVHTQVEQGATATKPVWGPVRPTGKGDSVVDPERDPVPPTEYDKDNYEWGVGEEADFITFNPLFDPHLTNWILAEDVTGYNTTESYPPRRTAIITASRLSKRLLNVMHRETVFKRHSMFSEMWPGSMCLQHGFKAVYAPHPVYVARRWPTAHLASVFNNGLDGAAGGSRISVFSDERQHNFIGTTWYYHAVFSANLWKRWLGYKVDGEGGEEWEMSQSQGEGGQGEGRMCLPAMLLHPIKQVDLITERKLG